MLKAVLPARKRPFRLSAALPALWNSTQSTVLELLKWTSLGRRVSSRLLRLALGASRVGSVKRYQVLLPVGFRPSDLPSSAMLAWMALMGVVPSGATRYTVTGLTRDRPDSV